MSEHDENRSPVRSGGGTNSNDNTIAEDGNNSIMGKVKSRVSSIIPNRLSKWFSPSANNANNSSSSSNNNNNNDSINGNLSVSVPRRRRRIEIEDDEEEISRFTNRYGSAEDESNQSDELQPDDGNSDDDSNNSETDQNGATARGRRPTGASGANALPSVHLRQNKYSPIVRQPPSKRSRMNISDLDVGGMRDSTLLNHHHKPLVASTPAVGTSVRSTQHTAAGPRLSSLRYRHMPGSGAGRGPKEPAYNFASRESNPDDIDIIDLVPLETETGSSQFSNRRSLNIPQFSDLKRHSLYAQRNDELPSTSAGSIPARRTSTTIHETAPETELYDSVGGDSGRMQYNGQHNTNRVPTVFVPKKRQKLANGVGDYIPEVDEEPAQSVDSASESSECSAAEPKGDASKQIPHKTGLFNMSGRSGGIDGSMGSRPSSTSNGLNFFTHLEGRKSLFSGSQMSAASNSLNSSTLSLNALNRRQFNASIYGSTSALSDSRLLNTFSPFYKGRTTYGGAAAYNKYTSRLGPGTGAGASSMRITPTLIRPTSSLSVLSTSSNSLAGASVGGGGGAGGGGGITGSSDGAPISSTAKRILDLINDFATPLSEAKKMANNIKTAQLMHSPYSKVRLNETDLNTSRAVRLSQVRTPYKRPTVTLTTNAANGKTAGAGGIPPTRELQVPSMSQLLQLKKMQSTTERSRQIAANSQSARMNADYKLAVDQAASDESGQNKLKHVNKMKNKLNAAMRSTSSAKDKLDDEPLPPVNLPNIAFPLMQSVPKFDIALPVSQASSSAPLSNVSASSLKTTTATTKPTTTSTSNSSTSLFAFKGVSSNNNNAKPAATTPKGSLMKSSNATSTNATLSPNATKSSAPMFGNSAKTIASPTTPTALGVDVNFKFSEPLALHGDYTLNNSCNLTYKFSPPAPLISGSAANKQEMPSAKAPLKSGSVLDALQKPFAPKSTASTTSPLAKTQADATLSATTSPNSFGSQFKKATNQWECDTCMIRNKEELTKCVACETPRKTAQRPAAAAPPLATTTTFSSFGDKFKKSAAEWECDACMIRNKQESSKCVACETPRKQSTPTTTSQLTPAAAAPSVTSSFGDAFKPKANSWECPTCMISNKADVSACVACETKKPGVSGSSTASATTTSAQAPKFSFGFAASGAVQPSKPPAADMDSKFKSLVAEQASSKWECEACMTRNDVARSKCVCCEQPKPGAQAAASAEGPKFAFGTAAAKKYTFGFAGTAAGQTMNNSSSSTSSTITSSTAPAAEKTETNPSQGFVFGSGQGTSAASASKTTATNATGFSFGLKTPAAAATATTTALTGAVGKDVADSTKAPAAAAATPTFKIGAPASSSASSSTNATVGFTFGTAAPATSTPAAATTTAASASTNTISTESTAKTVAPAASTLNFGASPSTTKTTPASGGFTFGTSAKADSTAASAGLGAAKALSTTSSDSTVTASKPTFSFGTPASPSAFSAATTAATSTATTNAAAVKPMFSFGASTTSAVSSSGATTATTSSVTAASTTTSTGLFGFGAAPSSASKPLFGDAVSSSSSAMGAPAAPKPTASTSGNVFGGVFGGNTATPMFGDVSKVSSSSTAAPSTTTTTTTTFGGFGSSTSSANNNNMFSSPSGVSSAFGGSASDNKPTGTATPLFGNVASSTSMGASSSTSTPFTFGSSGAMGNNNAASGAAAAAATTTASGSGSMQWPKNQFVFGSAASTSNAIATPSSGGANQQQQQSQIFGSFGSAQPTDNSSSTTPATSLFGSQSTAAAAPPAFGSAAPVFGSQTAPSTNLFGNVGGGNAAAASSTTSAFGAATPFGGATTSSVGFGSASTNMGMAQQPTTTFGGFGSANNNSSNNHNNGTANDGASAPKKSEPAFNFGGQQSSGGAFNFGAQPTAAFNFGATSAAPTPTFNFTGTTETQATKPFQFGAAPTAPVYNFMTGAAETTPNAPFQFNAGAASASTNIFAPAPPPGGQAAAQQARRKIRQPIRRMTPR